MEKKLLSFVIPCYRSENTIKLVVDEIVNTVNQREDYDYEIIAVNDCSPDGVYNVLKSMASINKKIMVIDLARNVGKHSAVMAGYSYANGDFIVNLDDDYQSPVCRLWDMIDVLVNDSCDVVTADYIKKRESTWKRIGSSINYSVSVVMLDKPRGLRLENFSVIKRFVMDEVLNYKNPYPFLEGLYLRVTKRVIAIPMEQRDRGDTKETGFSFWKSLSLFANAFTNFSVKPLRIALIVGMVFALLGFTYGVVIIIRKLILPSTQAGWSSIMAVVLFSCGMIMLLLGIIGEYVGRIFICINDAPQFVVRETINTEQRGELQQNE